MWLVLPGNMNHVCFHMVFRGYFHLAPSNLDLNVSNLGGWIDTRRPLNIHQWLKMFSYTSMGWKQHIWNKNNFDFKSLSVAMFPLKDGFTGRGMPRYEHSCRCTSCPNSDISGIRWLLLWRTFECCPAHRCGLQMSWGCALSAALCTQSAGRKGEK